MQLVERHIFKDNIEMHLLCFKAKNLFNYSNYVIRQAFTEKLENISEFKDLISNEKFISEYELTTRLAKINQYDYRSLPSQSAQQIIKLVYKNWKSFFKSIKSYKDNNSKYLGRPKMPKYKDKNSESILIFTNQQVKIKNNYVHFPKATNIKPIKTKVDKIDQVRIIPKSGYHIVEIIYTIDDVKQKPRNNRFAGIDLGVSNIITYADNVSRPIIVNGGSLKRSNQWWNKQNARLKSLNRITSKRQQQLSMNRDFFINDKLHKISRFIINECISRNVNTLIVGYNKEWKQKSKLSKKVNQSFVGIPHHKLIHMLQYKCKLAGIEVILQEESYTSKCDSLVKEIIDKHAVYSGTRKKRGLFQSSTGKLINADVNGALNIMRKAVGDDSVLDLINVRCVLQPIKVNL